MPHDADPTSVVHGPTADRVGRPAHGHHQPMVHGRPRRPARRRSIGSTARVSRDTPLSTQGLTARQPLSSLSCLIGLTCTFGAPRGIRTPNRQIRSLVLYVDLVGPRRIWAAHVGWVVDSDGSRRILSDRLDDQPDDQAPRRGVLGHPDHGGHWWSEHQIFHLATPGGPPRLRAAGTRLQASRQPVPWVLACAVAAGQVGWAVLPVRSSRARVLPCGMPGGMTVRLVRMVRPHQIRRLAARLLQVR